MFGCTLNFFLRREAWCALRNGAHGPLPPAKTTSTTRRVNLRTAETTTESSGVWLIRGLHARLHGGQVITLQARGACNHRMICRDPWRARLDSNQRPAAS